MKHSPLPRARKLSWTFSLGALLLSVGTLLFATSGTSRAAAPQSGGRVVVLGFDGGDGRTAEQMMDAGELPNMQALREKGTFARLGTTVPAESPVCWASLNSGQNPAKTGVAGFMRNKALEKNEDGSYVGFSVPTMGHLVPEGAAPLEQFADNLPLPLWSAQALGGAAGGVVLVAFFIVFAALLRMRAPLAFVLALALGAVAGWVGYSWRESLPSEVKRYGNPMQARNFWDYAAEAGKESIILEAAQAFDMDEPEGVRLLAGLGVPDARGGIGDWFVYSTKDAYLKEVPVGEDLGTAGRGFRVHELGGQIATKVVGPINHYEIAKLADQVAAIDERMSDTSLGYKESIELRNQKKELEAQLADAKSDDGRVMVDMLVELRGDEAAVTIDGQQQVLSVGEWSDWYYLTFPLNSLFKVQAVTRAKLVSMEPFELFMNTLDIDPADPPFYQSISHPHGFSNDLVQGAGRTFETYGWACATMPFKEHQIAPETLLEDIEFTMKWREDLTYHCMDNEDWDMLMTVFSTTDRVQHMMYQYYDPSHPLYDPAMANHPITFFGQEMTLSDAVPEIYRQADRVVGEVVARMDPEDTLLICADHGFQSFKRQFNINNWLAEEGYLTLKEDFSKKAEGSLGFIDWNSTRAYSLGLGFIYLNLEGRERNGQVGESQKDALLDEIERKLLAVRDPETGEQAITSIYRPGEIHPDGDWVHLEADLILGFAPTYRVSWKTSLGGFLRVEENGERVPGPVFTDNDSPWSGGHVSMDVDAVKGMFFCNKKVQLPAEGPDLLHIAPTALSLLGVEVPAEMDLPPLKVGG